MHTRSATFDPLAAKVKKPVAAYRSGVFGIKLLNQWSSKTNRRLIYTRQGNHRQQAAGLCGDSRHTTTLVYKKPMPGLSPPPRTCRSHWKHANVGVPGPRLTVVHQRKGAAASEPIQPPDGQKQPRRVLRPPGHGPLRRPPPRSPAPIRGRTTPSRRVARPRRWRSDSRPGTPSFAGVLDGSSIYSPS